MSAQYQHQRAGCDECAWIDAEFIERLESLISRRSSPQDAKDIVAEAIRWWLTWKKDKDIDDNEAQSMIAWKAVKIRVDWYRKRSRNRESPLYTDIESAAEHPARAAERLELDELLPRLLSELTQESRAAFDCLIVRQLTQSATAHAMGRDRQTVVNLAKKACQYLQRRLREYGYD